LRIAKKRNPTFQRKGFIVDLNFISLTEFINNKKRLILVGVIISLVLVSWSGILDYLSYDYLKGSLLSALSSYAVSRSLNGIISVLQSSTLSVGIASVSVGELLDPVNDIVERFSDLLTVSIGSIIIQKVLLSIVSSAFFKGVLTASGIAVLTSLALKKSPYIQLLTRAFIFLVFLRLSLGLMIVLNSVVDNSFLAEQITTNYESVRSTTRELDTLKHAQLKQQQIDQKLEQEIIANQLKKERLNKDIVVQMNIKKKLKNQIDDQSLKVSRLKNKLTPVEKYNLFRVDDELDEAEKMLAEKQDLIELTDDRLEDIRGSIRVANKKISDNENQIADTETGLLDNISKTVKYIQNINIEDVKYRLDYLINNLLDLMALYIMKTVILPVFFMYLLMKSFKLIWSYELQGIVKI